MLKFMEQMSPKNTCFRVQRPYCLSVLMRLFLFSLSLYTDQVNRQPSVGKQPSSNQKKKKKEQTTFLTQNYVLTNFRPVFSLSVVSKRIEKIVHDQHFRYVDQSNLWHTFQSTFIIILTDLIAAFNNIMASF